MAKQTAEDRLNALLGITSKVQEVKTRSTGKVVGVTETEIQEFREAQGLEYFLQAPALFSAKVCPHCGDSFLVSRKYVSYCSYTCIRKSLEKLGIGWSKGKDLEGLANDSQVYQGNEPIWITRQNLEKALGILESLLAKVQSEDSPVKLEPRPEEAYQQEPLTTSTVYESDTLSSDLFPTTPSKNSKRGTSSSKKSAPKRKISFGTS
jgi:hypothetical protein